MPKRSSKRGKPGPADPNETAARIMRQATGQEPKEKAKPRPEDEGKDPAAVELGRKGGKKGGRARAEALTPKERSAAAKKAADARWKNQRP